MTRTDGLKASTSGPASTTQSATRITNTSPANPRTPTGSALPEALIWHGMKTTPDGQHYTAVYLLDAWVRKPLYLHGCQDLIKLPIGMVNDMLYETKFHTVTSQSINPLHAFANLMEELTEQPEHEFWDPAIAEIHCRR